MIYLNTKEDFFNHLYEEIPSAIATLQEILDDRFAWKLTEVLANKESGIDDETHTIQESDGEYLQFTLLEDENALLFRLGFTVEEAQTIIDDPVKALDDWREQKRKEEEERLEAKRQANAEEYVAPTEDGEE